MTPFAIVDIQFKVLGFDRFSIHPQETIVTTVGRAHEGAKRKSGKRTADPSGGIERV